MDNAQNGYCSVEITGKIKKKHYVIQIWQIGWTQGFPL